MIKKLYGLTVVLLMWFFLYLVVQSPALPNPFITISYTATQFTTYLPHLGVSMLRILVAVGISALIGIGLGILMGVSVGFNNVLSPIVYILYPIPKIAFLPVLMLLFGLGETPKIMLIFSVIVFQFMMSTKDAIGEIEPAYFDSVHSLGLKGLDVLRHCILPAILPSIFTSLRIAFGVSIAILFFAENFSTKLGIGYFIMNSYAMANYQSMYAGIIMLSLMGLLIYSIIDLVERKACPWLE